MSAAAAGAASTPALPVTPRPQGRPRAFGHPPTPFRSAWAGSAPASSCGGPAELYAYFPPASLPPGLGGCPGLRFPGFRALPWPRLFHPFPDVVLGPLEVSERRASCVGERLASGRSAGSGDKNPGEG